VTGNCGGGPDPTNTETPPSSTSSSVPTKTGVPVPTGTAYDYVIVGGGAGGLPMADRLSAQGKKVLLIEKGPPSTGRWGGSMKPAWLEGTSLTRFDVPGLCNQIWHDSAGIACTDTDQMAGCVLGGGTAVNAGLWWKPYSQDWDYNFPSGWKSNDVAGATNRVFSKIPGTTVPSTDGKLYLQQGFDAVSSGLRKAGWSEVSANQEPNRKNRTFTHTPYMFSNGERGGPLATYLVSASQRSNFKMWTGTAVKRVIRSGGHVTGLEVEPFLNGGYTGTVLLTPVTGRVILSAGTFGSAKILLRSELCPCRLSTPGSNMT
jgi:cellobiose dehydrogenase (acceptor)